MKRGADWPSLRFAWVRQARRTYAAAWITPMFRMVVDRRGIRFIAFADRLAVTTTFERPSVSMFDNAERAEALLLAWGWGSTLPDAHGTHEQRNGER